MGRARIACRFGLEQGGQTLVVVALVITVLLGAVALGLDWGYGFSQRRSMQNASDAAAVSVGRYLATSVISVNGSIAFLVHGENAWCTAKNYADQNHPFALPGSTSSVEVQFGSSGATTTWTTAAHPAGDVCPPAGPAQVIPANTIYIRALTTTTYRSLFGAATGQTQLTAAASARVRLSGTPVPLSGPVWPMVRHYNPAEYNVSCPPGNCDPTTIDPLTFWSPSASDVVYGNFKGLIDFSRNSSRYAPTLTAQLLSQWDRSGSLSAAPPTAPKADTSGNCGGPWDTAGGEDPQNQDKQCSIPNWYYYAFQGTLGLDSTWSGGSLPAGQETPSALTARSVCQASQRPDPAPSCTSPSHGDWLETAGGNVGSNMSANMTARIAADGRWIDGTSNKIVQNGPNKGNQYGKALTILVYLWDCAEHFDSSASAGSQWSLILPPHGPADCSQIPATGNTPTPDRVHLFTVAPFTFYAGLVTSSAIEGYWGGMFGDPAACQSCALNPLANTAFLIPDD